MHKKYTKYHMKLLTELILLRKGRGLTPAKLHNKMLIRDIMSRTSSTHNPTNSQVHNLLLEEIAKLPKGPITTALHYALNIADPAKESSTLFQRRSELASLLNKHTDTIIRYENQAFHELALLLEERDSNTPPTTSLKERTRPQPSQITAQTKIIRSTATASLTGLLPIGPRGPELITYLEQSQRPYLEVDITITFLPSPRGPNWYRIETAYKFQGLRDAFRLAVVTNDEDGEHLIAQGLIDDFYKLNDHIDPKREIRGIINGSRFTAHDRTNNTQKLLRFRELSPTQTTLLLQSVEEPLNAHCTFLEVTIPLQWQREGIHYEYQSAFSLRDDIHYAYWYAPSMMFLKKLTFNYLEFPNASSWNFTVMPFLGAITSESIRTPHSFTARPNNWIMPGHGIALTWEPKIH